MKNKIIALATALAAATSLAGCFTGVESTPKITAGDVRRQDAASVSPEALLIQSLPVDSIETWKPGKRFIVVDSKAAMVYAPPAIAASDIKTGIILTYKGNRPSTSITGAGELVLHFSTPAGNDVTYTAATTSGPVDLPFTVDLDLVDSARTLLNGRELWVTSAIWRDSLDNVIGGLKYVPVRVTNVAPGTGDYPVRIDFSTVSVDPARNGSLYISTASRGAGSRRFETQFALDNPRRRYPEIEEKTWDLIARGMVAPGMTRQECRLALGAPTDIDRRAGYSTVREIWTYENGIYLIFSDGILIDYRR